LIPIQNRSVLNMYKPKFNPTFRSWMLDTTKPIGKQILLNYCFGHGESFLLLCPYGPYTGYINHNQTLQNVDWEWNGDVENIPLNQIKSGLISMRLVAIRDIMKGEEIFLNYGNMWEEAWKKLQQSSLSENTEHRSAAYCNAKQLNITGPYPESVVLKVNTRYSQQDSPIDGTVLNRWPRYKHCSVTKQYVVSQEIVYDTVLYELDERGEPTREGRLLEGIRREAFRFFDRPYNSPYLSKNAFRHEIQIPDELFPEKWKNRKQVGDDTGALRDF